MVVACVKASTSLDCLGRSLATGMVFVDDLKELRDAD